MATCLARDLTFDGEREVSDEQFDDADFFTMADVDEMVATGAIDDGQSITAIHLVQKWIDHARR